MAVDWVAIKAEYATTKTSYAKLAQKYDVSISAIKRKAASEKWTANRTETEQKVYQKAVQKATSKVSSKIASEIVTRDRVVEELARIAFVDRGAFARVVGDGRMVELTDTDQLTADQRAALAGVEETRRGIKVSTYDKVRALELLGKHLGLFDGKGALPGAGKENNLMEAIKAAEEDVNADDLPEVE